MRRDMRGDTSIYLSTQMKEISPQKHLHRWQETKVRHRTHSSQLCPAQRSQQHNFADVYWVKKLKPQCSSLLRRQKHQGKMMLSMESLCYMSTLVLNGLWPHRQMILRSSRQCQSTSACSEVWGVWPQRRLYCYLEVNCDCHLLTEQDSTYQPLGWQVDTQNDCC